MYVCACSLVCTSVVMQNCVSTLINRVLKRPNAACYFILETGWLPSWVPAYGMSVVRMESPDLTLDAESASIPQNCKLHISAPGGQLQAIPLQNYLILSDSGRINFQIPTMPWFTKE